jgi:anti-anti-sigma factor
MYRIMTTTPDEAGRACLAITGEVDASNASELCLAILNAGSKHESEFEVDLAGVTFMDSTGLRAITDASVAMQAAGSRIVLRNVPRQIERMLEITGEAAPTWGRWMTAFERSFPPRPEELPPARAALREWLHDVGIDGADATSDVLIVTSELVTNGVFHDGGALITLRAQREDDDVSIEVTTVDHLPGRHPTYRDIEDSVDGGRGLAIVHALSHGYSVARHDHERVTVCRIPARSAVA